MSMYGLPLKHSCTTYRSISKRRLKKIYNSAVKFRRFCDAVTPNGDIIEFKTTGNSAWNSNQQQLYTYQSQNLKNVSPTGRIRSQRMPESMSVSYGRTLHHKIASMDLSVLEERVMALTLDNTNDLIDKYFKGK